ncbi:putative membrane protein [Pectobacterium atrosepticum SCRI1043]|uniref:Membrane protein n=1 Tax=Pectobacterium atrosepticum (strain SCRI 1043 / ATCC BAA-672) TaxID=218491 RepID=Q6D707_PECAS|nr:putative membrane protein [Pectobacterium atrosepticum SCRI1043]
MRGNRSMCFLRWGSILFVLFCYLVWLFISLQPMSVFMENETLQFSNSVSAERYSSSLRQIKDATESVFDGYVYGFLVCVPVILLLFKKIR